MLVIDRGRRAGSVVGGASAQRRNQCSICQKNSGVADWRLASTEGARIEAPQAPSNERRRREGRCAEGNGVWGGDIPLCSRLQGLGERRALPRGVRDGAPSAKIAFLAYFRVTARAEVAERKMQHFLPHIFSKTEADPRPKFSVTTREVVFTQWRG